MTIHNKTEILSLLKKIEARGTLDPVEIRNTLPLLAAFECWAVYDRVLENFLGSREPFDREEFVTHLVLVVNNGNWNLARMLIRKFVKGSDIGFQDYKSTIVDQTSGRFNYGIQAKLLEFVVEVLESKSERILFLEYLIGLYEKKFPDENKLSRILDNLVELDPTNSLGLKHLKNLYWHNNDFEGVLECLKTLIGCESAENQKFRLGLEMASLYLYQLENPTECLKTIDMYCRGDYLDSTALRFEALVQVNDLESAKRILEECLSRNLDEVERSILMFRLGMISVKLGEPRVAQKYFEGCLEVNHLFFEAVEVLIDLHLRDSDWSEVIRWLEYLKKTMRPGAQSDQIDDLLSSIDFGLQSAG